MNEPVISVVVPTYQRGRSLHRTLRALVAQDLEAPYEVLVVDNGSTDGTRALVKEMAALHPALRPCRLDRNAGPGPARNLGWRRARAALVAFTDDDCEPDAGWLRALLDAFEDPSVGVVMGRTVARPEDLAGGGPFSHFVRVEAPMPWFPTCNVAYRRDLLLQLDGFDESFTARHGSNFGDDTDLGWRALEAGAGARFAPHAVVVHEVTPSDWRRWMRARRRRDGIPAVVAAHPGLRAQLPRPWLYERAHPRALVAAAGMATALLRTRSALGWAAGIAGVGQYWRYRTARDGNRPVPGMRRPTAVAGHLAADLVELAVVARGAVRARTLVL